MPKINCPNVNTKEWKTLAQAIGKDKAYLAFFRHDKGIPDIETAKTLLASGPMQKKLDTPKYRDEDYSIPVTPEPEHIPTHEMVSKIAKDTPVSDRASYSIASSKTGDHISWKPDGKNRDNSFLSKIEKVYTNWKEVAFPLQKVQDIAQKEGVKIIDAENIDYAIDQARGAGARSKQFIDDNLKPIFDAIPKERGRVYSEAVKYLVAKRSKDLYESKEDYIDGNYSKETADRMVDFVETGAHPDAKEIQRVADGIWGYGKKLRQIKLDSGIIDDDLFDSLIEDHYVPFMRDTEGTKKGMSTGGPDRFTATSRGIMRIKGSVRGLSIIDPIQGLIRQTHETIQNAAKARVANTVVDLAERSDEIGKLIKELPPRWIKAGTIEHRGEIDMLLRPQIEGLAKELGITVEYKAKLAGQVGGRLAKVLGLFKDDKIKALVGSTEGTLSHELGHGIHRKFGWMEGLVDRNEKEMNLVADSRYEGEEVPMNLVTYARSKSEKAAEFVSMYINDRNNLQQMAPDAVAEFEAKIKDDPILKKMIDMKPSNVSGIHSIQVDNFVKDRSIPQDEDVISMLRGGNIKSYRVPLEIASAIKNLHPAMFPAWFKVLMTPNRMLRAGAVGLNIDFVIPNLFKDQMDAAINAKTIPVVDMLYGMKSYLSGDEVYQRYNLMGGGMESPESGVSGGKKTSVEMQYGSHGGQFLDPYYWKTQGVFKGLTQAAWYGVKSPFKGLMKLAETSEMASRLGTFRRAEKGLPAGLKWLGGGEKMGTEAAIHLARQATLDFQRFGKYGRTANELIPFLNAAMEGIDKMARTFKDDPKRAIMKSMVYAVGPMVALYLYNKDDPKYKLVPLRDKIANWIIMKKEGGYWKIPKGHITKWVVNGIQIPFEAATGLIMQDPWQVVSQVAQDLSPVDYGSIIPPVVKLLVEPMANYDFYWQQMIEKPAIHGIPIPGLRWDKNTSGLLKSVGKALNISPVMMQHELETLGAGFVKNTLWASNVISGNATLNNSTPVVRRFSSQLNDWNTDIDKSLRAINQQLSNMNDISFKKMVKSYGHTPKDIEELRRKNTEFKHQLLQKRYELQSAKSAIIKLSEDKK